MRRALVLFLLAPAALAAQSRADATLCDRVGDARHPDARATVQQLATGGGARGGFFAGCLLLDAERFSAAADEFERVVKADDRNPVAHFFLGRAYGEQAQRANVFKQASLARKTKSALDRAVQLDPDYVDARQGLVEYYSQAPAIAGGSKEKARAQVEEIRRRNAYRGGFLSASLHLREKNVDAAVREWQGLTTQFADSGGAWVTLAWNLAQRRRADDAFATLDRMARTTPSLAMLAQYTTGRLSAEFGLQLDRGEQALRRYLTHTPRPGEPALANAHWRLGAIHERRGQKDSARAEYRTALSLDAKLAGARDALAKLR
jgi:tetratricopeptide (TPR) repeat protein